MFIDTRFFQMATAKVKPVNAGPTYSGWFRLAGYGLKWRLNPPEDPTWRYYSERSGYVRSWRLGRLIIAVLPRVLPRAGQL